MSLERQKNPTPIELTPKTASVRLHLEIARQKVIGKEIVKAKGVGDLHSISERRFSKNKTEGNDV